MADNLLQFNKENFIPIRKENVNTHYEVIAKELGRGAYGVVYKGRIRGTEGPWRAIKKIPKIVCDDPTIIKNQIDILLSLDNPNIVKLYEIYQFNQSVYLVTDLCEGGQLFDRLDTEGNPTEKQTRIIFRQMLEAVNYLHVQKIVHRDLKPENFLFMKKKCDIIKLIDFGLARRWKESLSKELLAETDKIVGTSYYIAPEMIRHDYDQRCDIWSLGVILYMLITGSAPFDGTNDGQIMEAIKNMKYSLNIPEFKGVSREVKDLIFRMLMPAERRISIQGIFAHPWMRGDARSVELNIQFKKMVQFSKFSKLKKLTANFIAFQMSQKQVQKLAHLFRKIDVNHDGCIDVQELKSAFTEEKNLQNSQQFKQLMEALDIDHNGKINYTQFLAANLPKEVLFTPTNLLKMFKLMDKDGNGHIDRAELHQFFKNNQMSSLQGKTIDSILQTCDKDKNGVIDFEQFKAAIMI